MSQFRLLIAIFVAVAFAPFAMAEDPAAKGEVVIYTALDREFSEPILKEFEKKTGIEVRAQYDSESVKTVGLVNRMLAERARPRADVLWNNEILRSIQLKKEGLTAAYDSPSAKDIPAAMKDADHHWTGFAARARIIMVNKKLLPDESQWPKSVADIIDPKWKGRAAIARPLFGTTSTHAAVIWANAGEAKAQEFWSAVIANAILVSGNAQARDAAASGEAAWCLTDTDDAHGAIEDGAPVAIIYPKEDVGAKGALLIPNTLVLLKDSPNQENGKKLIDYLLSREVEQGLAELRSAQIPVRSDLKPPSGIPTLSTGDIMPVDWQKAYEAIAPSSAWLQKQLADK
ncbi:extracellular solute-binding protein [soil metagenome]